MSSASFRLYAKRSDDYADAVRAFKASGSGGDQAVVVATRNSLADAMKSLDPAVLKAAYNSKPTTFMKNLEVFNKADQIKIAKKVDDATLSSKVTKMKSADDVGGAATKGTTKYDTAQTLIKYTAAGIAGFTLINYLDKKYDDEEKIYRNCMAACLPHNWDEYQYGAIKEDELEYSTPDSIKEYQIEPIPNQPYCKRGMECENFCGVTCGEEAKADIPLLDLPGNVAGSAAGATGQAAGQVTGGLFGGTLEGLGAGGPGSMGASAVSAILVMAFFIFFLLRKD
jgi:hypothetical protein